MKGRVLHVIDASKRSGTGKTGKPYNIMSVEIEKEDGAIIKADSFDVLADGDTVEIESSQYSGSDGKSYTNWNAKIPKQYAQKPSQSEHAAEQLQAIRMVFREIKKLEQKVDLLLGPVETESKPAPLDLAPTAPLRDWDSVGQPDEPTVEPVPDLPGDLEDFMNQ